LKSTLKTSDANLSAAQKHALELEALVREKNKKLTSSMTRVKTLEEQLHDADAQVRNLRVTADTLPAMKSDLDQQTRKFLGAETRIKDLERDLVYRKEVMLDVQAQVEALKIEKRALEERISRLHLAADNRFAGIHLTGRRVIFLIDISGSMLYVDEKTKAPDKWGGVIETTAKIMKSLPDLEKFQVILFNENARFLFGSRVEWLDIDSNNSTQMIERVRRALEATEVDGNTNMYAAFEKAFQFRERNMGLDTIYLLSDGLPNQGPLAPEDQN